MLFHVLLLNDRSSCQILFALVVFVNELAYVNASTYANNSFLAKLELEYCSTVVVEDNFKTDSSLCCHVEHYNHNDKLYL